MPTSFDSFRDNLASLISKFEADKGYYLTKGYLEAQARVDFVSPLFKALGWDMENEAGLAHLEREVIVERGESDTTGRPDYNFRIAGQTKFFVEAKAPSEPLDDTRHILQAKGYAWNTKSVLFVVLTDFVEFRFYDASIKPDERKPDEGLLLKLKYSDYLKNAAKLWEFSRERVLAGALDAQLPRDRRTARLRIPVDEAFLDEMTGWREDLARDIHKNNHGLTARQLNEAVQRLLDRVVFIRIAEDRRIIERYQLRAAAEEWRARGGKFHIFDWLRPLFEKINEDFNGEIFKPNELLESLQLDSEVLVRIIEHLYPPKSPYRFDVIGVELLGSIYERYLGKTIRPTAKTVRVKEKPEVRKAGGVYYTPQYIVDYIVKNTVGKTIHGKSPKQIEKIRILDPACGSGSFLIGAFQRLIDHHLHYLSEHPQEANVHPLYPDVIPDEGGQPRLSVRLKAKILHNNLFGVDIDPQAVEITMMSLYLKALEGEKSQLPPKQHVLPELKYNIICGNSLIGPDVLDQGSLFGDAERDRINAFDWSSELVGFGQTMKQGGFDCIVGNPPYIRSQSLGDVQRRYYEQHYRAATGTYDIYVLFVERALAALKKTGRAGFILPNKFFTTDYGAGLRNQLTDEAAIERIVDFEDGQVFDQAGNYTCLLFFGRGRHKSAQYARLGKVYRNLGTDGLSHALRREELAFGEIQFRPGPGRWTLAVGEFGGILSRLQRDFPPFSSLRPHIFQGLKTSADKVYLLRVRDTKGRLCRVETASGDEFRIEASILRPVVKGEHVQRYWVDRSAGLHIIYPYELGRDGRATLVGSRELRKHFPRAWEYLNENRKILSSRDRGLWAKRPDWYAYARSQNIGAFVGSKLLIPYMTKRLRVAPDQKGDLFFVNITTGGYGARMDYGPHHPNYVTGLLNSFLLSNAIRQMTNAFRGGYIAVNKQGVERLPFRTIRFSDPADKRRHDKMVALVERMLESNERKHSGRLAPSEIERIDREVRAADAQIDELVCELYGITDEERKIIENG